MTQEITIADLCQKCQQSAKLSENGCLSGLLCKDCEEKINACFYDELHKSFEFNQWERKPRDCRICGREFRPRGHYQMLCRICARSHKSPEPICVSRKMTEEERIKYGLVSLGSDCAEQNILAPTEAHLSQ